MDSKEVMELLGIGETPLSRWRKNGRLTLLPETEMPSRFPWYSPVEVEKIAQTYKNSWNKQKS